MKVIAEADRKKSKGKNNGDNRRRRTEQEEDEELLQDERVEGVEAGTIFTESPSCRYSRIDRAQSSTNILQTSREVR